ncbi:MAG: Clp protease N-terminal domain-containing protein [Capsulimonas sp.]|uniref:Clp protease N-terminal domain-containing protein n=1 Tax=Capsulimonas sp. TaxID=2494211 RepID=UPI003264B2E0
MWQRFSERARKVIFYSQEEARYLGENYVGPEHILLGLLREANNVAGNLLQESGVDLVGLRVELLARVKRGEGQIGGDMQLTPRAKYVIDFAYEEARALRHNYIGTEHLLMGLVKQEDSAAGKLLAEHGVTIEDLRAKVRTGSSGTDTDLAEPPPFRPIPSRGKDEEVNICGPALAAFIREVLSQNGEKIHLIFGDVITGEVVVNGAIRQLTALPGHLSADVRRYFTDWAAFSGGAELLAAGQPVRLAYSHLGRGYDFMLTVEADGSLTLSIAPV